MSTAVTAAGTAWTTAYTEPSMATPRDARHYVVRFLSGRGLPFDLVDRIGLVAWHLVDNAGRHGSGVIRISAVLDRDGVQISVHDQGATVDFGPDRSGLTIVKTFAAKFEIIPDRVGVGKTVAVLIPHGGAR